ncbi:MAG: hypothetical protein EOP45_13845 [Sphingobacteriaceae bacterium]|nr:MAG: hypothetical protein EOP45_13845 [Sphingobacteriaceae bacterium]
MQTQDRMSVLKLVRNENGSVINYYGKTGFGYIDFATSRMINGKVEQILLRQKEKVEILQLLLDIHLVDDCVFGALIVKEYLESEVSEEVAKKHYDKDRGIYNCERLVKRDESGNEIRINGERIVQTVEFYHNESYKGIQAVVREYLSGQ